MPFVTACSFCPHKLQVPDRALGACLCCPKCGNYFTVAPSELVPVKEPRWQSAKPSLKPAPAPTPPQPSPPAAELPWWVTSPPDAAVAPAPAPAPPPPPPTVLPSFPKLDLPKPPHSSDSEQPGWINAWGVFAFSLAAMAILLAAFPLPRYLSLSCAVLGLLLGLAGALMPRQEWKIRDAIWLALGGGGCGLLMLVVLARPGWLSDRWAMDFEVPQPDRNRQFMAARAGDDEGKEMRSEERVNAATHAIRQDDLLVRIESAEVKQLKQNDSPVLLLALSIKNVGHLHIITYRGQGSGEQRSVVRDSRGKELPQHDLGAEAHKLGQVRTVTVLPIHEVKDLLAVEAPWPGTAHVEVDLPAAAWGKEGVCKFTIPSNFLRR